MEPVSICYAGNSYIGSEIFHDQIAAAVYSVCACSGGLGCNFYGFTGTDRRIKIGVAYQSDSSGIIFAVDNDIVLQSQIS